MKFDVETRDKVVKEQEPAGKAENAENLPDRQCEDRVHYLEAILRDMNDGVIVVDRTGKVECMNRAALDMFGLRTTDEGTHYFKDTSRYEIVDAAGRPLPQESWPLARVMRGEAFRDQEVMFKDRATGREIPGIYDAAPLKSGGRPDISVITVRRPIERKGVSSISSEPGLAAGTDVGQRAGSDHGNWLRHPAV